MPVSDTESPKHTKETPPDLLKEKSIFGPWINDMKSLSKKFNESEPFQYVTIENFLSEKVAEKIMKEFPLVDEGWYHYDNPIEQKYSMNKFEELEEISLLFDQLHTTEFLEKMRFITRIMDLERDPHLHGAGLHAYPTKGKLDLHLDYSIHPISGKERRLNLILYMNKDWKTEYGGNLQLWDSELTNCTQVINPGWNTAILFRTSDTSIHGIPEPLKCPDGMFRKSIAIYYVSPVREEASKRFKAQFIPYPGQIVDSRLDKLYNLRKDRIIKPEDLADWPNWRDEGNGHW